MLVVIPHPGYLEMGDGLYREIDCVYTEWGVLNKNIKIEVNALVRVSMDGAVDMGVVQWPFAVVAVVSCARLERGTRNET